MSLEEYSRKRRFEQTPEPKPGKANAGGSRFFVQRHHASRLHYDFRLEIDGTLKSWAIPKGPTLDPAPKRLAAMVEDHPIDYGDFEGNIPAGNYGAGSVMLWDRGTFELIGDTDALGQIARGDLKFRLSGEKLNGEFAIVLMKGRGKGNEWLLLKKKDQFARPGWDVEEVARSVKTGRTQEEIAKAIPAEEKKPLTAKPAQKKPTPKLAPKSTAGVKAPMPEAITPMGATLSKDLPKGDNWLLEVKWDGVRAVCFIDDGKLRILTRNGNRCERQYPELSVLPHQVQATQAILDGEIAVLDAKGVSRFELIQSRIGNQDASAVAQMARKNPVHLFLFDLLYLDGRDLRALPLLERKRMLREVVHASELIRISEHFNNERAEDVLEAARLNGLEGLIAKCATSAYESRRSRDWLKFKLVLEQEFVICGYTIGERDYFGALVLGMYEGGKLTHAGNVGTGFDRKLMADIFARMERLTTAKSPLSEPAAVPKGTVWVRPELVCQIKFANWTNDRKLRAPVFLGLRNDVEPAECVREEPASEPGKPRPSRTTLLPANTAEATVVIDDRSLKFTNLKKVFFPDEGYTKRDLLNFYHDVAGLLLPHIADRPLSLKRYPNGIRDEFFFQKNTPGTFPKWFQTTPLEDKHYAIANDRSSLLFLTNLGCIDQNPWMSRVGSLENPDFILIDLDPQGCEYERIIEAAQLVRKLLDAVELEGYPKTTGGDGMHVYVPVEPHYTYEHTKSFCEVLARTAASQRPDLFTTPRAVAKRENGKVYFDYLQNGEGKTIAAPYVVRAYPGAPVATPLSWGEVTPGLLPSHFTIANAMRRFDRLGDLFAGVLNKKQTLETAIKNLEKLVQAR